MYIKKIQMKDYKRFHDLTIDLGENPKRIVALVGPNGCGKSSVFDAMLYKVSIYGKIGNGNTKDYHYHSLTQNPSFGMNNVIITFDKGNFNYIYENRKKYGQQKSIMSFRSSFRYNNNLKITQTMAVEDMLKNSYGASFANETDTRIEESYRRLFAKYNNYRDENDVRPSEARAHIIGELNTSLSKCLDLKISNLGNVEGGKGTLYFKKSDSPIEFEYNVLSAGEKEVIDILLDLYLRKDLYDDSIYIIDEPELHLNTSIERALLIEINKIIPENCQIWIATHSIGFLRALQIELKDISQIIEFKKENVWASKEYVLTPVQLSRSQWQNLFSTALDDLSQLICPKTIIYCEGKDKPKKDGSELGLDAEVYNKIFSEQYPDVLFVSSGGNTELDQRSDIAIAIFSKVFSELQILVLKDRDMASGKMTSLKDRDLYLENNPKNHRVLKRFEIENYLYDIEVLKAYCLDKNLEFNLDKYNNIVKDINNDNLKDQTSAIKSCCNITSSLNPEVFKKNLASYITNDMEVYKELEEVIFNNN